MSLKERIQENNCDWLEGYLKDLLRTKDIKTYNRVKNIRRFAMSEFNI